MDKVLPMFSGRDIISMRDFSYVEIITVLELAEDIKNDFLVNKGKKYKNKLAGMKMKVLFTEPSTRTRLSFTEAGRSLGMEVEGIAGKEGTSLVKGESLHDTLRMLIEYSAFGNADAVAMRDKREGSAKWAACCAKFAYLDNASKIVTKSKKKVKLSKPIILNGGDGANQHPTQCLLDLFSIYELLKKRGKKLSNFDLGIFNDLRYGRTAHSLITVAALIPGIKLHFAYPEGFGPDDHYFDYLNKNKVPYVVYSSLEEALPNCDFAYMTRFQEERFHDPYEKVKIGKRWAVDKKLLSKVKLRPNIVFMHPLPINNQMSEIGSYVDTTRHAYYFQQAKNGVYVRMALLLLTLGFSGKSLKRKIKTGNMHKITKLPIKKNTKSKENLPSGTIQDGYVIDHIPCGKIDVLAPLLGLPKELTVVTTRNISSGSKGKKDILKILSKDYNLTHRDLTKITIVAPLATVNKVKDNKVVEKFRFELPDMFEGIIKCPNPRCITNEDFGEWPIQRFHVDNRNPVVLRCDYCEKSITEEDMNVEYPKHR